MPAGGTQGQFLIKNTSTNYDTLWATMTGDVSMSGTASFTATIATAAVTYAKFQQVAGLSVPGIAGTATAVMAALTGVTDQVVRVAADGASLGFGQINLSAVAAVTGSLNVSSFATGVLSVPHGGIGTSILTAFGALFGSGTAAVVAGTAFLAGQVLLGQSATSIPVPTTLIGDIGSITAGGTATIATAAISYAKIQNVGALSVFGNTSSAAKVGADVAGTADQVLRVASSGTALGFGQINLSTAAAVTGVLPVGLGGSGTSTLAAHGVVLGNGTSAVSVTTAPSAGQALIGQTTTSDPSWKTIVGDISWTAAGTATIGAGAVTYAKIQNVAGLSVFGNSSSAATVGADITGVANNVLVVNSAGTGLGFGQVNLSSTSAVTGNLAINGNAQILQATAVPAGGTAGSGYKFSSVTNFGIFFGSGAPSLTAGTGSLYLRTDGSTTTSRLYVNSNGSTTWVAMVSNS